MCLHACSEAVPAFVVCHHRPGSYNTAAKRAGRARNRLPWIAGRRRHSYSLVVLVGDVFQVLHVVDEYCIVVDGVGL